MPRNRAKNVTFWDKFWRDEYGRDVIWQRPNAFLITWIVVTAVGLFLPYNHIKSVLGVIGTIAILIWAVLEIYSGVNGFRRLLGVLVLIAVVISRIR